MSRIKNIEFVTEPSDSVFNAEKRVVRVDITGCHTEVLTPQKIIAAKYFNHLCGQRLHENDRPKIEEAYEFLVGQNFFAEPEIK